jgi:hypothetical protein
MSDGFLTPLPGLVGYSWGTVPTAGAVGFTLLPLPGLGFIHCRVSHGTRLWFLHKSCRVAAE